MQVERLVTLDFNYKKYQRKFLRLKETTQIEDLNFRNDEEQQKG